MLWEKKYPADVDWFVNITGKPLYSILDETVVNYGNRPCIDFLGKEFSYKKISKMVDRAALGFQKMGVKKGTKVGLFLPNCPQFVISYFGILKAGGVVVNFSPLYAEDEIVHQLEDSDTDIMVTLNLKILYPKIFNLLGRSRLKKIVVGTFPEVLPFPKNILFSLFKRKETSNIDSSSNVMSFGELLNNDGNYKDINIELWDFAIPNGYTSEKIPSNDKSMEWFRDRIHFKSSLGNKYPILANALACKISQLLNLNEPGCFDVMANCTGFQTGLDIAFEKIKTSNNINKILVVAVAMQSRYIDWRDKNSAIYFGDGASAAIVSKVSKKFGHLGSSLISNTKVYDAVRMRGGGSSFVTSNYLKKKNNQKYEISGLEVWKQVVTNQPKNIRLALKDARLKPTDIDYFIFHQANYNLIKFLMHRLEIPISKTFITANKYGNTADASIGITLHEAVKKKKIKKNDIVLISGVGAGFIFGTTIVKWSY